MAACDVATDVPSLCTQLQQPFCGVVHTAGVLRDALLDKHEVAATRAVFAAKVLDLPFGIVL